MNWDVGGPPFGVAQGVSLGVGFKEGMRRSI